jgi:hypothetical protein
VATNEHEFSRIISISVTLLLVVLIIRVNSCPFVAKNYDWVLIPSAAEDSEQHQKEINKIEVEF